MLELQKKAGKKVPQIELQTGRQSVKLALRDIWFVESEKNYLLFIGKRYEGRGDSCKNENVRSGEKTGSA